jgi:hypothetical protein
MPPAWGPQDPEGLVPVVEDCLLQAEPRGPGDQKDRVQQQAHHHTPPEASLDTTQSAFNNNVNL